MTQLAPDVIEVWLEDFIDSIEDYSEEDAAILQLTPAEYARKKKRGEIDPALDRWIVRQALNCLDRKSSDVRVLRDSMRTENPDARRSGYHLLQEIRKLRTLTGVSARRQAEDYDSAQFFKVGDSEALTKDNATRLRESFEALPESRTGAPNALLHAVIKKMPIAVRKEADDLEDELVKAEALGREPPWGYRNLVTCVAHQLLLQRARAQRNAGGREAAALEQKGGDPSGGAPSAQCPCCGKPGHVAKFCTARCGKCKVKGCPGTFGRACVVCSTAPITSPVPNAVGGDCPDFVHERLIKKQKEFAAKKKKEAAVSEAKAAEEKEKEASAVDAVGACDDLDAIDLYNEFGEEMQREASVCDCFPDGILSSAAALLALARAGSIDVNLCERGACADGGDWPAHVKIEHDSSIAAAGVECMLPQPAVIGRGADDASAGTECMLQQLEAQPVERGAEASVATLPADGKAAFMLDRGSNTVLFADGIFGERGMVTSDTPEDVTGVWNASTSRIERQLRVRLRFGSLVVELEGGEAPNSRRNILSESALWDALRWTVFGEPYMYIATLRVGSVFQSCVRTGCTSFRRRCSRLSRTRRCSRWPTSRSQCRCRRGAWAMCRMLGCGGRACTSTPTGCARWSIQRPARASMWSIATWLRRSITTTFGCARVRSAAQLSRPRQKATVQPSLARRCCSTPTARSRPPR